MISQRTIDQVFEIAQIEQVVGEVVQLTKKGSNFAGLCPFHTEKTPSFSVSPAKGIYHCFGCGQGGNAVTFVMKQQMKSFPDAIQYLAEKYNVVFQEEKPDPEREEKLKQKISLFDFNKWVARYFISQLFLPDNSKALDYVESRFTKETIHQWNIGFAAEKFTGLLDAAMHEGYDEAFLITSGLVKRSAKNGKVYDFFQNRIIFPVWDHYGNIVSFSGRSLPGDDKQAKYINLSETLSYKKGNILYGLNFALKSMIDSRTAVLVEGNPDAIRMHEIGVFNVVASSGTALAGGQVRLLKKYAEKIILLYDGDDAGQKALVKSGKILVENGLVPYAAVLPASEDPDTFFKTEEQFDEWTTLNKKDFISWFSEILLSKVGEDPEMKNQAIIEISNMLVHLSPTKRDLYIEQIGKLSKLKAKLFQDKLKELEAVTPDNEPPKTFVPDGVDANEFEKWGFYIYKNEYYFRSKQGIEKLSNFVMKPVFHMDSIDESKRIYELANTYGYKVVVDLDMQEMTSLQAFQRNVEGRGNFLFWGTVAHFSKLKLKLYEETRTCQEVKVLGWQKEGFWAWANGMITDDGFTEIDEFGIVKYNDVNFFIPAFSKIYINDKSQFRDERKFKFKKRDIELNEWATLFIKVFGDNARIGIAYWIAAVFRDHLLHIFKNFPMMNLFGPKGTGKSQMANSLSCLFGEQQTAFNIHNGTKPGLAEHLQHFSNALVVVEEYKNSIEFDKIETLKAIYDSVGRSRMNIDKKMRKETTDVNSAVIVCGQEMPTADVALFSRMLFLQFHQTEFSDAEKNNYDRLKTMERPGLAHLSSLLLNHRHYFVEHFFDNYSEVLSDFSEKNRDKQIEDRIMRNMCTAVAAFKTLQDKINLPFNYTELLPAAFKAIRDQNGQIGKSNEIGMFWNLLEAMFDENQLVDEWHFRIDFSDNLKTKERDINLGKPKDLLKFKFNIIYKLYAQHSRNQGGKPLPSDTLQYYLRNHKHFIGVEKSCRFTLTEWDMQADKRNKKVQVTTAYCFDYEPLEINLRRESTDAESLREINGYKNPDNRIESSHVVEAAEDKLPF